MKRLILVRHGKSSWDYEVDDKERPLKDRAYQDAEHVISAFQAHLDYDVQLFSSPALRAKTTAELFKAGLKIADSDFKIIKDLYTFKSSRVLDFIRNLNNGHDNVMLFGHNPAYTELVSTLGSLPLDNLPTTGLVSIRFDIDKWINLKHGNTLLYLFPKHLR